MSMKCVWKGWAAIDLKGKYTPELYSRRSNARLVARGLRNSTDSKFVVRKAMLMIDGKKKS